MPGQEVWRTMLEVVPVVLAYMTTWFLIALAARRNDVVDVAWGLGFIVAAAWLLLRADAPPLRQYAASALVTIWGLRLAWHIGRRNLRPGTTEDARYAAWRREWGRWLIPRSFLQIFMLQGFFMLLVSSPVQVIGSQVGPPFGVLDAIGVGVWVFGFVFESVGDRQLRTFLAEPANRGTIMDRGLWAYTRHPNYFGEAAMWWGVGIMALSLPGGWIGLVGPVTITWLLTMVSGVPMLERLMEGRPGWAEYKARTSVFIPLPPKKG